MKRSIFFRILLFVFGLVPVLGNAMEQCGICMEPVDSFPLDQQRVTTCCRRFICRGDFEQLELRAREFHQNLQNPVWRMQYSQSPDFNGWPTEELEHAKCPFCRHHPLEVEVAQEDQGNDLWLLEEGEEEEKECLSCLDDLPLGDFIELSCGHSFCKGCFQQNVEIGFNEKSTAKLTCLHQGCEYKLDERDVKIITNNDREKMNAFAEITTMEWIAKQPNAKHCPTSNCKYVFLEDSGRFQITECPLCKKQYCSNCLVNHDGRISCQNAQNLNRRKNKDDIASENWIRENAKHCPRCNVLGYKESGCDYIKCRNCQYGFCWTCLGPHDHNMSRHMHQNIVQPIRQQGVNQQEIERMQRLQLEAQRRRADQQRIIVARQERERLRRIQLEEQQKRRAERERRRREQLERERQQKIEQARIKRLVLEEKRRRKNVRSENRSGRKRSNPRVVRVVRQKNQAPVPPPENNQIVQEAFDSVRITSWKPGVVASGSLLARHAFLRKKQEKMPIWVRVAFNEEVTDAFVTGRFYLQLNRLSKKFLRIPMKNRKFREEFMFVVDRTMTQEEVIRYCNLAYVALKNNTDVLEQEPQREEQREHQYSRGCIARFKNLYNALNRVTVGFDQPVEQVFFGDFVKFLNTILHQEARGTSIFNRGKNVITYNTNANISRERFQGFIDRTNQHFMNGGN